MQLRSFSTPFCWLGVVAGAAQAQETTAAGVGLVELHAGRLVDVHAEVQSTGVRIPVAHGVVVSEDLPAADTGYALEVDAVTGGQRLVVPVAKLSSTGVERAEQVVRRAGAAARSLPLQVAQGALASPPYVARDGALSLRFAEPLDQRIAASGLVSVSAAGGGSVGARVAFGAEDTIVVDFSKAPLPAASSVYAANLVLDVRTPDGSASWSMELRSGHASDVQAGVLPDVHGPRVVGQQPFDVLAAQDIDHPVLGVGFVYRVQGLFDQVVCAQEPVRGDVLELIAGDFRVVRSLGTASDPAELRVILLNEGPDPIAASDLTGPGLYLSAYAPGDVPECFVTFSPDPSGPAPGVGVSPMSSVQVRFNEPLDLMTVQAFDSLVVAEERVEPTGSEVVPMTIQAAAEGALFGLQPLAPISHEQGIAEPYYVLIDHGSVALTDLAGNGLAVEMPIVSFTLEVTAPSSQSNAIVFLFDGPDENGDGLPELRGQHLFDPEAGAIEGRPVIRFSGSTERNQLVTSLMSDLPGGVQTPLSPLGSKLMAVWRHIDFTMAVNDELLHNLDVEGLAWASDGVVQPDVYDEFEIALGHSGRFPDEALGATSNLPEHPNSGLRKGAYADPTNILDDGGDGLSVVHSREKGYVVDPADSFTGPGGSTMAPFPWNSDPDPTDDTTFTWRDTSILAKGGVDGAGLEPAILSTVGLIGPEDVGSAYVDGQIPTVGLPLLMQFGCFPDDGAIGTNRFDVSLAVNSSGQPNFRLFSTGGFDTQGNAVVKNPDEEDTATGGFNPSQGGLKTKGFDNVYYHGVADFVIRVTRSHSIWIDMGAPSDFLADILEPLASSLPGNADVHVEYRGAVDIEDADPLIVADAKSYDAYGDPRPDLDQSQPHFFPLFGPVHYLNDDPTWKDTPDELDGARYLQVRISLISDSVTGDVASLSALAVGYVPL